MSFHLSTKIYVGEKIFLGQNVISCFLLIFLIKLRTNNENNLESKYLWWFVIKANFLGQIIVEFY